MKISLAMGQQSGKEAKGNTALSEAEIMAAKSGDWVAKDHLAKKFSSLIASQAKSRAQDPAALQTYTEAGRQGLFQAAKKYKKGMGPQRFSMDCLDYIQRAMDRMDKNGKGGFLSRLFSRRP